MAKVATGDLGTLTMQSAAAVNPGGSGVIKYVRVKFTLNTTSAIEALLGFKVWHDNNAGSTTPVWLDSCTLDKAGGVGTTLKSYDVLVPTPLATTGSIWWESFEEYPDGTVNGSAMDGGSNLWSGSWA